MKTTIKKLVQLVAVTAFFLLASCEKDLYETGIQNGNRRFKLTKTSLKKIYKEQKNIKLIGAVEKVKTKNKQKKANGKLVYNENYGFYIDDEKGILIEKDGSVSYTFPIIRDVPTEKTENIVFNLVNNEKYDVYIAKYTLTLQQKEAIRNREWIDISSISPELSAKEDAPCNTVIDHCYYIDYEDGSRDYIYTFLDPCEGDSGGSGDSGSSGGSSSSGDSGSSSDSGGEGPGYSISTGGPNTGNSGPSTNGNGNTGGGGGPSTPNQVNTTPVLVTDPDLTTDPCEKIKKQLSKFPALKQSLLDLATTTSQPTENGIFIDNSATSTTQNPIQTIPTGTAGVLNINPNPTNPYLIIDHTHNSPAASTYSVPSLEDMITLADLGTAGHLDDNFVFYTTTADDTRYAITIENAQSFTDFFYNPLAHPGEAIDWVSANKYLEIATDYYLFKDDDPNYRPQILESNTDYSTDLKTFLSFLKAANLGATVFKVSPDFNTFTKVTLSSNNNSILPEDCN